MIEIKDLLLRWSNLILSKEVKKESIKAVLEKVVKIKIETSDIEIKNNTVYLNIKSIYKNEIFINQEKINSSLEEVLGKRSPNVFR
jgi:hypothetical protein